MRYSTAARMRARAARLGALFAFFALATLVAIPDPARAQWRTDTDLGLPVAVSGAVGAIDWFALFCSPTEGLLLTAGFSERVADAVPVVFTFRNVRYVVPFRRIVPGAAILYADLEALEDMRAALGGRSSSVRVSLDQRPLGTLSLRGSTAAIRDATRGCPAGAAPSRAVLARLEATADAIDPNAASVRASLAAEIAAAQAAPRSPVAAAVDVDKKAVLPPAVQASVDEIRDSCDTPGAKTRFEPGGLMQADINGDGAPDYMLSAHALECPASLTMFCGARACEVRVFASLPSRGYEAASVLLGDRYTFDSRGLTAPCDDPGRTFRIAWENGRLRTVYCR